MAFVPDVMKRTTPMVTSADRLTEGVRCVTTQLGAVSAHRTNGQLGNLTSFTSEPFAGSEQRDRSPALLHQISVGQRTQPPGTNTQLPERKTHPGVW
jgi:hypothetical protein